MTESSSSAPGGLCDDEAIAVTNENALYKAQVKKLQTLLSTC